MKEQAWVIDCNAADTPSCIAALNTFCRDSREMRRNGARIFEAGSFEYSPKPIRSELSRGTAKRDCIILRHKGTFGASDETELSAITTTVRQYLTANNTVQDWFIGRTDLYDVPAEAYILDTDSADPFLGNQALWNSMSETVWALSLIHI